MPGISLLVTGHKGVWAKETAFWDVTEKQGWGCVTSYQLVQKYYNILTRMVKMHEWLNIDLFLGSSVMDKLCSYILTSDCDSSCYYECISVG